jgi:hypothetical protein
MDFLATKKHKRHKHMRLLRLRRFFVANDFVFHPMTLAKQKPLAAG